MSDIKPPSKFILRSDVAEELRLTESQANALRTRRNEEVPILQQMRLDQPDKILALSEKDIRRHGGEIRKEVSLRNQKTSDFEDSQLNDEQRARLAQLRRQHQLFGSSPRVALQSDLGPDTFRQLTDELREVDKELRLELARATRRLYLQKFTAVVGKRKAKELLGSEFVFSLDGELSPAGAKPAEAEATKGQPNPRRRVY